jgi:hypothetical protein
MRLLRKELVSDSIGDESLYLVWLTQDSLELFKGHTAANR